MFVYLSYARYSDSPHLLSLDGDFPPPVKQNHPKQSYDFFSVLSHTKQTFYLNHDNFHCVTGFLCRQCIPTRLSLAMKGNSSFQNL